MLSPTHSGPEKGGSHTQPPVAVSVPEFEHGIAPTAAPASAATTVKSIVWETSKRFQSGLEIVVASGGVNASHKLSTFNLGMTSSLDHRQRAHAMRLLMGLLVSPAAAVFNCQAGIEGSGGPYFVGANTTICPEEGLSQSMILLNGFVSVFGNSNDDVFECPSLGTNIVTNTPMADCQASVGLINLILSSDAQYNPSVERFVFQSTLQTPRCISIG